MKDPAPAPLDTPPAEPSAPASSPRTLPLRRLLAVIVAVGTLVLAMTVYSYNTGLRMTERYTPLIDATMEIKLEATTAHLWFEEIISKDRAENIEDVRDHLHQADWYAQAMLEGGTNAEGTFVPLDDAALRSHIENVRIRLAEFNQLMEARWIARQTSGPGSRYDQEFDRVFDEFISETDLVETRLQELTAAALDTFKLNQIALGFIAFVATIFVANVFMRFTREQHQSMEALEQAQEALRREATTDSLTGIANRRHITVHMEQERLRAERRETPFCIILFDIDHFKTVNDRYGHDAGDQVLKAVTDTIAERLRDLDGFARWGGEEFLILLRATHLAGAQALAETCRARLEDTNMPEVTRVTASFGVAEYKKDETIRDLVHRADLALYAAKNAGRNRVQSAAD